ncbi:unnamed protein product [Closterium sp. NIES-54]
MADYHTCHVLLHAQCCSLPSIPSLACFPARPSPAHAISDRLADAALKEQTKGFQLQQLADLSRPEL